MTRRVQLRPFVWLLLFQAALLFASPGSSFAYNANGSTTNSAGNSYAYNVENRLTSATVGGTNIVIVYDGDGNRVKKVVGTTTNLFLVDDRNPTGYAQVLEELTAVGSTPSRLHTYGLDLISQRQSDGATHFYGYDGNGNVRYLTGTNAAVTDTYVYDAFGTLIANTGSTPNNYRYTGEQYDPNLGFYYLRARYSNPNTGRFWTRISFAGRIREPASLHRYLYCANDPVNNTDPSGRDTYTLPGINTGALIQAGLAGIVLTAIASAHVKSIAKVRTIELTRNDTKLTLFHYSPDSPESFVLGLRAGAFVTPIGGMDAHAAMFGLGIPRPNYEYTFRINTYDLGPANNSTPGRIIQYEVLRPTGAGSLGRVFKMQID